MAVFGRCANATVRKYSKPALRSTSLSASASGRDDPALNVFLSANEAAAGLGSGATNHRGHLSSRKQAIDETFVEAEHPSVFHTATNGSHPGLEISGFDPLQKPAVKPCS